MSIDDLTVLKILAQEEFVTLDALPESVTDRQLRGLARDGFIEIQVRPQGVSMSETNLCQTIAEARGEWFPQWLNPSIGNFCTRNWEEAIRKYGRKSQYPMRIRLTPEGGRYLRRPSEAPTDGRQRSKDGGSVNQKIEIKGSPGATVNQIVGPSNRVSQNQAKDGILQWMPRLIRWLWGVFSRSNKPKGP